MTQSEEALKYFNSCQTEFWGKVFAAEFAYLMNYLQPEDKILSVGCGPAIIEKKLMEKGFSIIGQDVSQEAIACVPDSIRTVVAPAEKMPFTEATFDVVLFIVSLQFVADYRQALAESRRVLKPNGRVILLLLNPESGFFKRKQTEVDSYVRKIKHMDLNEIEATMSEMFETQGEYVLGISEDQVFPSDERETAALYVMRGARRDPAPESGTRG
ncbi:MAG: class I SAM-dependent methyltransferase [Deltaproteobacteria bacterium]|nr:class I SAM-dependent methyltransferase [Deltaproteobacteria bacterium]